MKREISEMCSLLKTSMPKQRVRKIEKDAQKRYEQLVEENFNDNDSLQKHTHEKIYPAIALYEALQFNNVEQEVAYQYIHTYFQQEAMDLAKGIQNLLKIPGMYHSVPKIARTMIQSGFNEKAGFRHHFKDKGASYLFRMDMLACPYYEKCKKYNHPELTTVFCDWDDTAYGHMHKELQWKRTKTIGRNDDCCDFMIRDTTI